MTQIIVSGSTIINAPADDAVVAVDGNGIPTGHVTLADGSSYMLGDLHNYAGPIELHQGVSLPDEDPAARSFLKWNGSAAVTGDDYPAYQASLVEKAKDSALAAADAKVRAGITIASTGTPALDGTYAIDTDAKSVIDGIYGGVKAGDGLPGGGATFNYRDLSGTSHAFDETTFVNFAKAVRDHLYAIAQGESPSSPVSIP